MNASQYRQVVAEDAKLAVGAEVIVNWTSSHRYYRVPATVKKVNMKSVLVTIEEDVDSSGLGIYLAGHTISVPRFSDSKRWSIYNSVEPR